MIPRGFRFASTYSGIRKHPDDDLTLIVSDVPASAAGVFTQNQVCAAPVAISREQLNKSGGICRAVVVNAGNANCATATMDKVARETIRSVAKLLEVPLDQILLASTGVIGEPLDEKLILNALPGLVTELTSEGLAASAASIMTTDTYPKLASIEVETSTGAVRLAGIAKGAGMIHPNMATMLAFFFTDAEIPPGDLHRILELAVEASFNRISVDGDTSTNDTVFLLANGASKVRLNEVEQQSFQEALDKISEDLAVGIVGDGEGSQKILKIEVEGTKTNKEAVQLARAIANSPLVKTALAGADPNWGRVLSSAGAAGIQFDPTKVDIHLNGHLICCRGVRADFSEEAVQLTMELDESVLILHIHDSGKGRARFWTCDLTKDYIDINAEYRT